MSIFKVGIFIIIFEIFIFFKLFENKNKSVTKKSIFKQFKQNKICIISYNFRNEKYNINSLWLRSFNTTNALNHSLIGQFVKFFFLIELILALIGFGTFVTVVY